MRLVVHIGAATAAAGLLQRELFLNERALSRSGIHLPKTGRLDSSYAMIAHHNLGWQLLGDPSFRPGAGTWDDLAAELATLDADTVLLSSETFGRAATSTDHQRELAGRLCRLAGDVDDVIVVYVAREPLSWINALFVETVTSLGDPYSFDAYVNAAVRSGYCDLDESFRFWLDSGDTRFLALRCDELMAAGPLDGMLDALEIPPSSEDPLPDESDLHAPGPTAVEAMRALNANLRVMDPDFSRRTPAAVRVAQVARRRAAKLGWYDDTYWGWSPKLTQWAAPRLEPSLDAFAQAAWGSAWPMPLPLDREEQTANLIESDRVLYSDVFSYLSMLTRRYLSFAKEPTHEEAIDASTAVADEAERAAGSPLRGTATRAAGSGPNAAQR